PHGGAEAPPPALGSRAGAVIACRSSSGSGARSGIGSVGSAPPPDTPRARRAPVLRRSRAWENPPVGGVALRPFVNAAVLVSWEGDAPSLLARTQAIEEALGRRAGHARWADRAIDLDLLAADAI